MSRHQPPCIAAGVPYSGAALYAMLTRGAACCRRFAAWRWGCREYPTLTRGATSCRRFAAWCGCAGLYPMLTHGATCCRRFAACACRGTLVPWLRRGTHCLGGSASLSRHQPPCVAAGVPYSGAALYAMLARGAACCRRFAALVWVCRSVPHAYAWGYVLSPLRGLRLSRHPRSLALPGNALPWRLRLLTRPLRLARSSTASSLKRSPRPPRRSSPRHWTLDLNPPHIRYDYHFASTPPTSLLPSRNQT